MCAEERHRNSDRLKRGASDSARLKPVAGLTSHPSRAHWAAAAPPSRRAASLLQSCYSRPPPAVAFCLPAARADSRARGHSLPPARQRLLQPVHGLLCPAAHLVLNLKVHSWERDEELETVEEVSRARGDVQRRHATPEVRSFVLHGHAVVSVLFTGRYCAEKQLHRQHRPAHLE